MPDCIIHVRESLPAVNINTFKNLFCAVSSAPNGLARKIFFPSLVAFSPTWILLLLSALFNHTYFPQAFLVNATNVFITYFAVSIPSRNIKIPETLSFLKETLDCYSIILILANAAIYILMCSYCFPSNPPVFQLFLSIVVFLPSLFIYIFYLLLSCCIFDMDSSAFARMQNKKDNSFISSVEVATESDLDGGAKL